MPGVQLNHFTALQEVSSQFEVYPWMISMFIASLGISFFMIFKLSGYSVFQILLFNSYNTKFLKENYENRGAFWSLNLLFYFNYLVQWIFCLYHGIKIFDLTLGFEWSYFLFLAAGIGMLFGYNMLKLVLIKSMDKVFSDGEILMINAFSSQYIFALLGIVLSFTNVWFLNAEGDLQKQALLINFLLIAFAYVYKIIRFFIISLQEGIFPYYIILYLCTFEILPILILAKLILG